jgi:hypothetical protein
MTEEEIKQMQQSAMEWRIAAEAARRQAEATREVARIAIRHLIALLEGRPEAGIPARNWINSIGGDV